MAAGCVDAVLEFLEPARGARGDHDMRAARGQRFGDRFADAAARPSDERNLARQFFSPCGHCVRQPVRQAAKIGLPVHARRNRSARSEEHTSELQSLMRISYAVFCLKKKKTLRHDVK